MQRILILLFFMWSFFTQAQIATQFVLSGELYAEKVFQDSTSLFGHIRKLQLKWVNEGYFFSGLDSMVERGGKTLIYLYKGEKYNAAAQSIRTKNLHSRLTNRLKAYANKGYPFATIQLDSVRLQGKMLTGEIITNLGPEIRYDSAHLFNEFKTNKSYLFQLLDIEPETLFSEKSYASISQKVERSSFLSINRPTDLAFQNNKAKVYLDIEEHPSNTFQGVIGLQQESRGKTVAVGSIELDIQNLFRSGKQFKFFWERYSGASQRLELYYKHPFFLDSKISPSFHFDLLKQDTTFLTRRTGIGLHTYIAPRSELFMEYEMTKGTLLAAKLENISGTGLADFSRAVYTVKASRGLLSVLSSLREDIFWEASLSAGKKTIERNLSLPDSYYDTLQIVSNFYRIQSQVAYQIKMFKRQSIYHHLSVASLNNDELLTNELYRLGGLASIRGFNEKSIFAKQYLLSRMEFRSFFEERSYAYVFYDQLLYSNQSLSDNSVGLGVGFALATSAGQFSFALAVGESKNQSLSASTMKAHFGYISRF